MSDQPIPTPADVAALTGAPTPEPEPAAAAPETPPWGEDFDAEKAWKLVQNLRADKEKLASRPSLTPEQENRLKEYDRLVEASKTDADRAQEARERAESRAAQAMERVARSEVKAALAGLVDDPDSIIEDLNLARFMGEDGEVNEAALAALKQKYSAFAGRRAPRPDPSQASAANGRTVASPAAEFASILQRQLNPQ